MVDGGMTCVKYLIFIFNFVFWLSGISIIVVGALIQVELSQYNGVLDSSFTAGAILLIVVGCIVTVLAFFGCCGASKENHCMIMTFAVLLGLIFILELAAGITCYVYRDEINKTAHQQFDNSWNKYNLTAAKDLSRVIDAIQHDLQCCGVDGKEEWTTKTRPWGRIPESCCEKESPDCVTARPNQVYTKGCYESLKNILVNNVVIVAGVGIGVSFIQLVGIVFACCLASAIRKNYEVV